MHTSSHFIYSVTALICASFFSVLRLNLRRRMAAPLLVTSAVCCALHLAVDGWHESLIALLCGMIAAVVFSLVHFWGGLAMEDVLAIGIVGFAGGSKNIMAFLLFTALAGAFLSFELAHKRQRLTSFLRARIREAAHAPYEECVVALHPYVAPEVKLRRYYGHAVTIGALLALIQVATL